MLGSTQVTQAVVAVPVKAENRIHEVLESPRAGEHSVFGDVTNDHRRCLGCLGIVRQCLGALSHLGDRADRGGKAPIPYRLDGIDHDQVRCEPADSLESRLQVRCRDHVAAVHKGPEPFGTAPHLLRRLFGDNEQRLSSPLCSACSGLQQERRFADPWLTADQGHRAGDEASGEHSVELCDPGWHRI